MRVIAILLYPNMRHLSLTFEEMLNPDAEIKKCAATFESLYGKPRLLPVAERISSRDLTALAQTSGISYQKEAA